MKVAGSGWSRRPRAARRTPAGHPSVRTCSAVDLERVERRSGHLGDGLGRLVHRQGEDVLADLRDLVAQTEAGRPGEVVVTADEHETDPFAGPLGHLADLVEQDRAGQVLEVFDHEGHRRHRRQLLEQDVLQGLAQGRAVEGEVGRRPRSVAPGRTSSRARSSRRPKWTASSVGRAATPAPGDRGERRTTGPGGPTCRTRPGPRSAPRACGSPGRGGRAGGAGPRPPSEREPEPRPSRLARSSSRPPALFDRQPDRTVVTLEGRLSREPSPARLIFGCRRQVRAWAERPGQASVGGVDPVEALDGHAEVAEGAHQPLQSAPGPGSTPGAGCDRPRCRALRTPAARRGREDRDDR